MTLIDKKGEEIEVNAIDGDIGECAWITGASYTVTGKDVPDDILDWLNDHYQEMIYDEFYQRQICAAEARADAMEDR